MIEQTCGNQELGLSGSIYTSFLCILFGANAIAVKVSFSGLGVFTTAGIRFTMASIVICLWAITTGRSFSIKKEQIRQILMISVFFTAQLSLMYIGISKSNASRCTLIVNLQPFFVLFLAHFFIGNDRITKRKLLGILMGFIGVAFVFMEKGSLNQEVQTGDLTMLVASFLWACNAVYIKKVIGGFQPFHVVLFPMIFSIPFFFVQGFLWDATMIGHVDMNILAALFFQGIITTSFCFVAWSTMLQKHGAVSLHTCIFIVPVAGVFLGALILNEPLSYKILSALVLILFSRITHKPRS